MGFQQEETTMSQMDEYISCRDEYMKRITGNEYDYMEFGILADIAWSLHNISAMLMEQNGYLDCYDFLDGKEIEQGENNGTDN